MGSHEHLPFGYSGGRFDTSAEAAYPTTLCHTLVKAIVEALRMRGVELREPPIKTSKLAAIVSGKQPPKTPNLVPEFSQVLAIKGVEAGFIFELTQKQFLKECYKFVDKTTKQELASIHAGAKLFEAHFQWGNGRCTYFLFEATAAGIRWFRRHGSIVVCLCWGLQESESL